MALQSVAVHLHGSSKLRTSRVEMTTATRALDTEAGLLGVDSSQRHRKLQSLLTRVAPSKTEPARTGLRANNTACRHHRSSSSTLVGTVSFQEFHSSSNSEVALLRTSTRLQRRTVAFRAMTMLLRIRVTPRSQVGAKRPTSSNSRLFSSSSSSRPRHFSREVAAVEEAMASTSTSRKRTTTIKRKDTREVAVGEDSDAAAAVVVATGVDKGSNLQTLDSQPNRSIHFIPTRVGWPRIESHLMRATWFNGQGAMSRALLSCRIGEAGLVQRQPHV